MFRMLVVMFFVCAQANAENFTNTPVTEPISQLSIINLNNHVNQIGDALHSLQDDNLLLKQRLDNSIKQKTPLPATPQELSYLVGLAGVIFVLAVAGAIERNTTKPVKKTTYRKKSKSIPVADQKVIEEEGEYDFMSSSEAIPAKFNLIEAYLSMNNYDLAQKELKMILKLGDIHQQNRAKMILNQIPITG